MSEEPSVLILAAGASQRLGEPKALARIGPRTALEHLLTACGSNQPPTVVTGAHEAEIAAHLKEAAGGAPEANLAFNAAWARGRTGSVQRGARALADRDILLAPIDVPLVPSEVFTRLRQEWARAGRPAMGWLAPSAPDREGHSRPGHPIVIGRGLVEPLSRLDPDAPLKLLREHADPVWMVEVGAVEIHDDLDRPEDLEELRRRFLP